MLFPWGISIIVLSVAGLATALFSIFVFSFFNFKEERVEKEKKKDSFHELNTLIRHAFSLLER
jgi:hypothetical protein